MPKVRVVKSLSAFSVDCIVGSMRLSCASYFLKMGGDAEKKKTTNGQGENAIDNKVNNLFQQLPAGLLEEIIMLLTRDRVDFKNQVLNHLITPHLQYLRLIPFLEDDLKFFTKFEKLQVFHTLGDDLTDHCLSIIGTYCKCLRILNIRSCYSVTDAGIEFLCIDNQGSAQCKSLQILCIQNCYNITKRGIRMALENLSAMRYLEHDLTFEVTVELAEIRSDKKLTNAPGFQLSILRAPYSCTSQFSYTHGERRPYRNNSLGLFFSLCPLLVKLELSLDKGFMDTELRCLISLKMLRELIINRRKDDAIDITFDGGVAPVLRIIGCSQENLNLSCLDFINLWDVIDFCPKLISLTICRYFLLRNTFSLRSHKSRLRAVCKTHNLKTSVLMELENLNLDCGYNVPSDVLLFLLSSPSLMKIYIRNCDTLTDDIFLTASQLHLFQNLNMSQLISCNSVTYQLIDLLMTEGNPLSDITTQNCPNITVEDIKNWKRKFCQTAWNVRWYFRSAEFEEE